MSKNWQIDHLHFYYPNAVKDIKDYNKLLINMASPDDESLNWTSYTIKKIYGSDGKYIIILNCNKKKMFSL